MDLLDATSETEIRSQDLFEDNMESMQDESSSQSVTLPPLPEKRVRREQDKTTFEYQMIEKKRNLIKIKNWSREERYLVIKLCLDAHKLSSDEIRMIYDVSYETISKIRNNKYKVKLTRNRKQTDSERALEDDVVSFILSYCETYPLKYKFDYMLQNISIRQLYREYVCSERILSLINPSSSLPSIHPFPHHDLSHYNNNFPQNSVAESNGKTTKQNSKVSQTTFFDIFHRNLKSLVKVVNKQNGCCQFCLAFEYKKGKVTEHEIELYRIHTLMMDRSRSLYYELSRNKIPSVLIITFDFMSMVYLPRLIRTSNNLTFLKKFIFTFFGIIDEGGGHADEFFITSTHYDCSPVELVITYVYDYLNKVSKGAMTK